MKDTIYRDDAIRVASGYCHPANVAKELAKLPSAEPERKTGRWIFNQYDANPRIGNWHCSECRQITIMPHDVCNYCPYCGAKMEVVK